MAAESPILPIFAGEVVDQAGGASEHDSIVPPDLTAAELLPGMHGAGEVVPGDDGPTESSPAMVGGSTHSRPTFTILEVIGGNMPSASSKFVGATPRAAVLKAARRIHKRSGGRTQFSVIMRRVASHKTEKKLYRYDVKMKKNAKPDGFVTLIDPSFNNVDGKIQRSVAKKIRIIPSSEHAVYGYIDKDGNMQKGPVAEGGVKIVRSPGTNTLYIVHSGAMPDKLNGVPVVKTEYVIDELKDSQLTEAELKKYDIAGQAKAALEMEAKKKADAKKAATERQRSKDKEAKEAAKVKAAAKRDRERSKAQAEKAKEQAKKEKLKAKALKAKEAAKKSGKKPTRQSGGASTSAPAEHEPEHVIVGGADTFTAEEAAV